MRTGVIVELILLGSIGVLQVGGTIRMEQWHLVQFLRFLIYSLTGVVMPQAEQWALPYADKKSHPWCGGIFGFIPFVCD